MVKADLTRDYYGDLEISSTADISEIKKQFKKLGTCGLHYLPSNHSPLTLDRQLLPIIQTAILGVKARSQRNSRKYNLHMKSLLIPQNVRSTMLIEYEILTDPANRRVFEETRGQMSALSSPHRRDLQQLVIEPVHLHLRHPLVQSVTRRTSNLPINPHTKLPKKDLGRGRVHTRPGRI
jgi:hypothetical protein